MGDKKRTASNYVRVLTVFKEPQKVMYAFDGSAGNGFSFRNENSVFKAVALFARDHFDMVIVDLDILSEEDMECFEIFREVRPSVFILALFSTSSYPDSSRALVLGADARLLQPFYPEELEAILKRWAERLRRRRDQTREVEQRLQVLAKLAKGVAHEINNPLTNLSGCLELLEEDDECTETQRKHFVSMKEDVQRVSDVVKELLLFSQEGPEKYGLVEVGNIFARLLQSIPKASKLSIRRRLKDGEAMVWGDEGLLEKACGIFVEEALQTAGDEDKVEVEIGMEDPGWVNISIGSRSDLSAKALPVKELDPLEVDAEGDNKIPLAYPAAWGIVRAHGGNAMVRGDGERIMEFTITLPGVFGVS